MVSKSVMVTISYEGSDEEEELKMVPIISINNNINIVSDSNSDDSDNNIKNYNESIFDKVIDGSVKAATPLMPAK